MSFEFLSCIDKYFLLQEMKRHYNDKNFKVVLRHWCNMFLIKELHTHWEVQCCQPGDI